MDRKQAELVADKLWRGIIRVIRPGFTGMVVRLLIEPEEDLDRGDLSDRDQIRIERAVARIRRKA